VRRLLLGAAGLLALAGCTHAPAEQLELAEAIAQQSVDEADVDLDPAHSQILDREDATFEYHVCALGTFTPSGPGYPWKQRLIVTVDWVTETGTTRFDDGASPGIVRPSSRSGRLAARRAEARAVLISNCCKQPGLETADFLDLHFVRAQRQKVRFSFLVLERLCACHDKFATRQLALCEPCGFQCHPSPSTAAEMERAPRSND
jgi:hypothetical protein